jgi:KUP system potassium uptake protein
LAGAYGTAVATTMLLTTVLLFRAMRHVWQWSAVTAFGVTGIFLAVDTSFFLANLLKIADGGWLPLCFAAALFVVMVTWRTGTEAIRATLIQPAQAADGFLADLERGVIPRVEGTTVFLTRSTQKVPRLIMDHARFVGVLPQNAIALSVLFENTPRVSGPNCSIVENVGAGLWHVVARFGFFEIPDLRRALSRAPGISTVVDFDKAMFVGTRDLVVHKPGSTGLRGWRLALFAFLYRNSVKVVDRFNLAPENVVEIARQIEI